MNPRRNLLLLLLAIAGLLPANRAVAALAYRAISEALTTGWVFPPSELESTLANGLR